MWHKPVVPEEDQEIPGINRPGSFYKYYRNVDDLPGKAKVFYEKAGKCETQFKTSGEMETDEYPSGECRTVTRYALPCSVPD